MKLTKTYIVAGLACSIGLGLVSCEKKLGKEVAMEQTDFSNMSFLQVYNGTLNSTRNYVYVDSRPVNGASLAYAATFPATATRFAIGSGYRNFLIRDTLNASTQPQMSFAENLQPGANYTLFMYDTLTTPKQKIVQNDIVIPDDSTARVRFANFIFTRTAVPNVDLYSVKRASNVFTNVSITDVTGFIPYASSLADTLYVRETGTTNTLATMNGFNPVRKRSYTLVFRGRYQTTGTTGVARLLSSFANN